MKILAIETGLFPDRETVEAAIGELEADHDVERAAATADMGEADWDGLLAQMLRADLIVTT